MNAPQLLCCLGLLFGSLNLSAQLYREDVQVILDKQELRNVQIGDLDNDGDLDLVGSRRGYNGQFVTYLNEGMDGVFRLSQYFGDTTWWPNNELVTNFELGDMDADGDLDLVSGSLVWSALPYYSNDGTGTFTKPINEDVAGISDSHFFRVGDLNGDGAQDVVSFQVGVKDLYFNQNDGTGTQFNRILVHETDLQLGGLSIRDFFLFDFDNDGDLDYSLVAFEQDWDQVESIKRLRLYLFEQTCTLCFEQRADEVLVEVRESSLNYNEGEWGDTDGDGRPEFFMRYSLDDVISDPHQLKAWAWEDIAGEIVWTDFLLERQVVDIELVDYDQDTDTDILLTKLVDTLPNIEAYALHWWENTDGFPSPPQRLRIIPKFSHVNAVDANNDGFVDVVLHHDFIADYLGILYGDANQNLSSISAIDRPISNLRAIATEDYDGDGDEDILFFTFHEDRPFFQHGIYRSVNNGDGTYQEPVLVHSSEAISGSDQRLIDLNGDGRLDMVGTNINSDNIRYIVIVQQTADGQFGDATYLEIPEGIRVHRYQTGEWGGDNLPDLLLVTCNGRFLLYTNNLATSGSFSLTESNLAYPVSSCRIDQLEAGDFNADGKSDVAILSREHIVVSLYDTDAQFADWDTIDIADEIEIFHIEVADINGDNADDLLITVSNRANELLLGKAILPAGDSLFEAAQLLHSRIPGFSVDKAFVDVNGDGADDFITYEGYMLSQANGQYLSAPYLPEPLYRSLPSTFSFNPTLLGPNNGSSPTLLSGYRELIRYETDFLDLAHVNGFIRWDTTATCSTDSLLPPLDNWGVHITQGERQTTAFTNIDGRYAGLLEGIDTCHISPVLPSNYWASCPPDSLLIVSDDSTNYQVDFAIEALVDCPLIAIDLASSTISQCFSSGVAIGYHNIGTAVAENVTITLEHDRRLNITSSSIPWTNFTDTTLTFTFEHLAIGERGQINLLFNPECDKLELGEILCFVATVTPDELCEDMNLNWDGANLMAEVLCDNDGELAYRLLNTGEGATAMPVNYRVSIVNDDIILYLNDDLILEPGQADTIPLPNEDNTWLLQLNQTPGHPYPAPLSLTTDYCESHSDSTGSRAQVVPNEEGDPFRAELCREVIGPYDPNDKSALPTGYSSAHYIERHWPLDYTIEFQNVGSDRARTVILHDPLSDLLDWSSFKAVAASHPYEWLIRPDGLLQVTFPDINLPDSTSNEAASKGFFSFQIQARADAPFETLIENYADIFFDFNVPIRTSTVQHRIRKPLRTAAEHVPICAGDEFNGTTILSSTIIKEELVFEAYDSITWWHIHVMPVPETIEQIALSEPGIWQGYNIQQDTTITWTLTGANGCDSLVTYQIDILTNTRELDLSDNYQLHPNPASSQATLWWDASVQPDLVELYNSAGKLVATYHPAIAHRQLLLEVQALPPGYYQVRVKEEERWGSMGLQVLR